MGDGSTQLEDHGCVGADRYKAGLGFWWKKLLVIVCLWDRLKIS
ncbi:speckle-type POZ protein [Corchorus olitorius]|uniref:Speckle-type POZ protein n=1 Tax=Corchorus olitorius TaxID=93759 RepID=A0A1R3IVI3_9ROSI|nr:speckle-type POZ protein [Corchorus olitorius]